MSLSPSVKRGGPPGVVRGGASGKHQTSRSVLVLGLVVAVALALYTTRKLHRMARIRGFVDDVPTEQHRVNYKSTSPGARRTYCSLWWRTPGKSVQWVEADCDYWERTQVGDAIEIVRLDGDVYLRDGDIYTSTGNFIFDCLLLAAELVTAIYCLRKLLVGGAAARS
jgi:hypothetical protein